MTGKDTAVIILAAGLGKRMNSSIPKVLHPLAGRPMLLHLLDSVIEINPTRIILVIGPDMISVGDRVTETGCQIETVIQKERLGTGHALQQTEKSLGDFDGDLLILYGDSPLITSATMKAVLTARSEKSNPAVVVLGFYPKDSEGYGKLIIDASGNLDRIVEHKDAKDQKIESNLCNSGVMALDGKVIFNFLSKLSNNNASDEFYLTDIVKLSNENGRTCLFIEGNEEELVGVNSRKELAEAETIMQDQFRDAALENGATLIDPSSVYFSYDTKIGRDVVIGPNVFFGLGVTVCDGVIIKAFCHIEGTSIEKNAIIGPFARLRPGSEIGEAVHIGNFVEVKKANLATGVKANHLSYIGDTKIGEGANIGAGTITCNFDGNKKSETEIGAGAFIGSNTALVAPVKVGENATIGAGSIITKDVDPGALALTRANQKVIQKYAQKRESSGVKK